MALVVQKYGGSSVSDVDAMRRVARRIVATRQAGNTVVVVVSAMGDTTDELLDQWAEIIQDSGLKHRHLVEGVKRVYADGGEPPRPRCATRRA